MKKIDRKEEKSMLLDVRCGKKAYCAHTLTHEELAILTAQPTTEEDKALIKWPKVKWVRQRMRTTFRRNTRKHPGTALARYVLQDADRCLTVCESCGIHGKMNIHHIDHNPNNNNLANLQVLCRSCHSKGHHVEDAIGVVEWYYGTKLEE